MLVARGVSPRLVVGGRSWYWLTIEAQSVNASAFDNTKMNHSANISSRLSWSDAVTVCVML